MSDPVDCSSIPCALARIRCNRSHWFRPAAIRVREAPNEGTFEISVIGKDVTASGRIDRACELFMTREQAQALRDKLTETLESEEGGSE